MKIPLVYDKIKKEIEKQSLFLSQIYNRPFNLEDKKEAFLRLIKSKNPKSKNKYKRVTVSPIRYAGGKSLAVGYIVERLLTDIKKLVSPFFGGGSVEIAVSKYLDLEVIGYDIFDILINYWKFQINNPRLLYRKLKVLKPNQETFYKIREILKEHWEKKIILEPLELAVYFYFNFNLSYGPGFLGWPSKVYLNEERYQKMIERVRDFNPGKLKVMCSSFEDVIEKYPDDFFYCDPPYYIGEDSNVFKGIYPMRNIPIHHKGFKHKLLRDLLKKHKGGFILSYNNCPTIRSWYKEYKQYFPRWQYTMGQGETRIGKNRKDLGTHIKQSHEILIYSPPKR
ncbi:MAG: DNA adenine methylase [Candidatus Helarchaeota archaeon]